MNRQFVLLQSSSWIFGLLAIPIGIINTFWGNDPGYGIFIFLLSFVYLPPFSNIINNKFSFTISFLIKLLLGLFILWTALGVGELFDKIDLMVQDL